MTKALVVSAKRAEKASFRDIIIVVWYLWRVHLFSDRLKFA